MFLPRLFSFLTSLLPWGSLLGLLKQGVKGSLGLGLTLIQSLLSGTGWAGGLHSQAASGDSASGSQGFSITAFNLFVFRKLLPPFLVTGGLLLVWQGVCSLPGATLPPPTTVLTDTWDLIRDPFYDNGGTDVGLFWQIKASLERVAIGFLLAAVVGIGAGMLVGSNRFLYDGFDPIFQILRTVPPLAWLPISLAAFRDNNPSAIFVIFITAIWPILINTIVGVQRIPQDYRNVARIVNMSGWRYFLKIVFPAAVPYIFTGLRIGVGLSWLAIVAAEMLIGGVGIGFFIWDAWNSSRISEIILALVYVGIVGFLLDRLMAWISTKVVQED